MATSIYKNTLRGNVTSKRLPQISTQLDSVKSNQFEVQFYNTGGNTIDLTLAAKQVQGLGVDISEIEVRRLNDTVYYPGKVAYSPLVITFDNLTLKRTSPDLWNFFKNTFDPITGELNKIGTANLKKKISVLELTNKNDVFSVIDLFGAYPSKIKWSDKSYSGDVSFSTIEVTFRYDYFNYTYNSVGNQLRNAAQAIQG